MHLWEFGIAISSAFAVWVGVGFHVQVYGSGFRVYSLLMLALCNRMILGASFVGWWGWWVLFFPGGRGEYVIWDPTTLNPGLTLGRLVPSMWGCDVQNGGNGLHRSGH